MKRLVFRKIIALVLTIIIIVGISPSQILLADPTVLQPPLHNRVSDIGYVQNVNSAEWYAQLKWDAMTFPPEADEKYINLGINEVAYGTGAMVLDAIQISLPGGATYYDLNSYNPESIKHGTIYESYVRGTYKTNTPSGQFTVTSQKSNPVKFLTGLHVSLELIPGTNNIKIKWDDVWDTSGRISYRILISDTKGFTQPPPIPDIVASEIGKSGSPVTVNRDEKKLEYIYTSALPGREYSIKVIPVPNVNVACATSDEISAIAIKTDILLKAQKVGFNNEGDTIWKLFWNPIVKGNTFTRVDYELYRYTNEDLQGKLFRLIPDIDSYQITIKKDDPNVYSFKIDAKAYVNGSNTPIEFRSNNKVALKEQIPQQPESPDIVDSFTNADPDPIHYDNYLTSTSASIFWRVPYTAEGLIDTDVTYDIYLVEDIKNVANPPSNYRIAADLSMGEANQIRDKLTGEIVGYRYGVEGLKSNSTYYFIIYAKKNFLIQNPQDSFMITKTYISKQSVKVIITKPDTGTDRPVALSAPPFGLLDGLNSISYTKATLTMDKRWYAFYITDTKRWEATTYEEYIENDLLKPDDETKLNGMIVNYMTGWTVKPHVVKYNDALEAIRLRNNRDEEFVTYSDLSQPDVKAFEIAQSDVPVPDIDEDEEQSFSFDIKGLTHNTTYLVWVTIENQNGNSSDPSDPLIITTPPQIPVKPVTPTVPSDLKGLAADTFVDLFWTFIKDMDYEIKGGKSDTLDSASITQAVSYENIKKNTFARINDLDPDTVYYFWIKAISTSEDGQVVESQYSNPFVIKTEAYKPPAPPVGFGVKSGADGVTYNSISYVWEPKSELSYILEFADNSNFDNSKMLDASGGLHTVTGLIANRRYYARLYAYNSKTKLRSEPTRAVMIVTNKSRSEYDGNYDLDEIVTGEGLIIPAKLENGVWSISSLGAQAHILSEKIRSEYDSVVQMDLSTPPAKTTTIHIDLGSSVIEALSDLKKELYVKLPWGQFLVRPGTFQTDEYYKQKGKNNDVSVRIEAVSPASQYKPSSLMQIKTPVTDLKAYFSGLSIPISKINNTIRVELPVAGLTSFGKDKIKAYSANSQSWYALSSFTDYANSQIIGELVKPGPVVAASWGVQAQPAIPNYIKESMDKIQGVYKLTSLEGGNFNPMAAISPNAAIKLIMDVVPAKYSDFDIKEKALMAGIIKSMAEVSDDLNAVLRKDKAVGYLISFYRLKTREGTVPSMSSVWSRYQDLSLADKNYIEDLKFAIENGIVQGNGSNLIGLDKNVTYGEFLVMLERTLRFMGEL